MAIQKINLGTEPLGEGGDTYRSANTKINMNFSNSGHCASKLVGKTSGTIPLAQDINEVAFSFSSFLVEKDDLNNVSFGTTIWSSAGSPNILNPVPKSQTSNLLTMKGYGGSAIQMSLPYTTLQVGDLYIRHRDNNGVWQSWSQIYTSGNTTIDSNKNIKTSSPVVRVFSDHLDKIHEANQLPIKYTRNGVGDYTIEGTTGLRENDWQIVIPEDDHRNQLIAFTIEDDNGTIRLKTYKRIFSMETFTFGPDLSTPLDIPEGRWVDLHFNDLPQEQLDDTEPEEESIVEEEVEPEVVEEPTEEPSEEAK